MGIAEASGLASGQRAPEVPAPQETAGLQRIRPVLNAGL
ncbi:hypothetical protein METH_10805 [Leisingera methylohalidivorans DSM 14336]|uniref:Uncharacterized protein n=1 Tax=Leisingera methylohalidivorans DSM 14336 TaxID=999552 RepID=V9W0A3_9RHOB|nr:hypothetical protein METH_10805 [Leisingera methylohalidivorans DSM 14336]